jgi:hypothetical protein
MPPPLRSSGGRRSPRVQREASGTGAGAAAEGATRGCGAIAEEAVRGCGATFAEGRRAHHRSRLSRRFRGDAWPSGNIRRGVINFNSLTNSCACWFVERRLGVVASLASWGESSNARSQVEVGPQSIITTGFAQLGW